MEGVKLVGIQCPLKKGLTDMPSVVVTGVIRFTAESGRRIVHDFAKVGFRNMDTIWNYKRVIIMSWGLRRLVLLFWKIRLQHDVVGIDWWTSKSFGIRSGNDFIWRYLDPLLNTGTVVLL